MYVSNYRFPKAITKLKLAKAIVSEFPSLVPEDVPPEKAHVSIYLLYHRKNIFYSFFFFENFFVTSSLPNYAFTMLIYININLYWSQSLQEFFFRETRPYGCIHYAVENARKKEASSPNIKSTKTKIQGRPQKLLPTTESNQLSEEKIQAEVRYNILTCNLNINAV